MAALREDLWGVPPGNSWTSGESRVVLKSREKILVEVDGREVNRKTML